MKLWAPIWKRMGRETVLHMLSAAHEASLIDDWTLQTMIEALTTAKTQREFYWFFAKEKSSKELRERTYASRG